MARLHVTALGPFQAKLDGAPLRLGPRLIGLLSILVIELGRPVPARRLVQLLWGSSPPRGAMATLRSHVSHLRRALDRKSVV